MHKSRMQNCEVRLSGLQFEERILNQEDMSAYTVARCVVALLCVSLQLCRAASIEAYAHDESRIVGGTAAEDGQFPYQVSLRLNKRHFCGGSIVNKRWILTAAHCLAGFNDTAITAVVGTNYLDKGGDTYQSTKTVGHPQYSSLLIRNDIGLIHLDKDIKFGDKVQPVKLPDKDFDKADYPAELSGWGTTSYPGKPPNELQHIKLNVIEQHDCLSTSFRVTNKNICTLTKKGEGACHGDSGGPLVADAVQIGVVSWGTPCAKGKPDVFTRVYSYADWIKKHIDEDNY